ncbi:hypothetical protein [Chryseobacterium wangxinyae]|uniref:hypothetical protein n=1 Tax=Chryseobacterium sp. CY353 TaxID=2997334 RepID=UPI0022702B44|nr:hypothetical protein [Chryseobacterium sp. CY353]MCY0970810.1 hypothetical protein [Chryseobacterium sp. CY353]
MKTKTLLLKKEKVSNLSPKPIKNENCSTTVGTIPPPTITGPKTLTITDIPPPPETTLFI